MTDTPSPASSSRAARPWWTWPPTASSSRVNRSITGAPRGRASSSTGAGTGSGPRARPASRTVSRKSHGRLHAKLQSRNASRSSAPAESAARSRRSPRRSSCSGILTGQTSSHARAQRRRVAKLLVAVEERRQHRADRAAVDPPVGGAAHLPVDRAHVLAGAAADAVEDAPVRRLAHPQRPLSRITTCISSGPSCSSPRRGPLRSVTYDVIFWPGSRAGEQGQEHAQVGQLGHDPLHPHDRDVHRRERRAHTAVALVRDEDDRARLGDGEVDAGDPDGRLRGTRLRRWSRAKAVSSAGSSPIGRPARGSNRSRT